MSNAITAGLTFLYGTLSADATFMGLVSGVFPGLAPANTQPDFCTITPMSSTAVDTAFGVKIMANQLYQVRVSGPEADYSNISAAYDRMLTDLQLVRSTSGILACWLQQDIYLQETVAGVPWVNLGGVFRIQL